jgi:hypothetical protein
MSTAASPRLILQSRDLGLLAELGEHGLLDTDLIHARHFPGLSRRRCLQRLAAYRQEGLTRTVPLSLWSQSGAGRAIPTIHCLTERGADAIAGLTSERAWRVSRGDPQPATIRHRLHIVRTKLAIDDACRLQALPPPQWFLEQDRDPAASDTLPPSQRRVLYHAFPTPLPACTCQPDAALRVRVPRDLTRPAAGATDLIALLEIDCSTEGHKQIARKLPGYGRLIAQRSFQRYFPASDESVVRVFWICLTEARIQSLCEELAGHPVAPYFRFATQAGLTPQTALTAPIWRATDGKRREIIRIPSAS